MAKKFLDETGVGTLWKKIKSVFATKTEVKNDHYTKLEVDRIQQGNVNALNNKLGKDETADKANGVVDAHDGRELKFRYSKEGTQVLEWYPMWEGNTLTCVQRELVKNDLGINALATKADTLPYKPMNGGLIPQESSSSWGVQTGQETASWADNTGGGLKIRRNCPIDGQMSLVIDGTVYVNEGNNAVYHDGNLIFSLSGSTLTITKR